MPESAPLNRDELACVYAALIMIDDDVAVTADKINSVLKAAKIQDVEPFWPGLFAKALEGVDGKQLITQLAGGFGGGGAVAAEPAAPAVVAAQAAPAAAAPAAAAKKEEKADSSSDEDMGLGLFD